MLRGTAIVCPSCWLYGKDTAMFHSLDPETGAALGSAGASIVITIQN